MKWLERLRLKLAARRVAHSAKRITDLGTVDGIRFMTRKQFDEEVAEAKRTGKLPK